MRTLIFVVHPQKSMKTVSAFSIVLCIISFNLLSCENLSKKDTATIQTPIVNTSLYGNPNFVFPEFSKTAKLEVSHWGAFEDFDGELKTLNGNTIEVLQVKSREMVSHLDSLMKKIPDTLNTKAIFSRVIVVKTRTHLLSQELEKPRVDSIQLQNYIDEMNISGKNLIIQINEKFEKDAIDMQKINTDNN